MDGPTLRQLALKVSQYFRDFLESDFKRQQAPRRRIVLQTEHGFRAGMRIEPYPELSKALWKLLDQPSGNELTLSVLPRRYTRSVSTTLKRIIAEHIAAIPETAIVAVRDGVLARADTSLEQALENPESWTDSLCEELATQIAEKIVRPLIAHLEGPLRQQAYSVVDSLLSAEADLIARVGNDAIEPLRASLAKYLATRDLQPVREALTNFLSIDETRRALLDFFDSFVVADAYLEFRDIETYISASEGLQLYLYIGSLKYKSFSFPLFFVPVEIESQTGSAGYRLTPVNHLYANRRAIDFVLQEIAQELQREWVSPVRERINYLTAEQSFLQVARALFAQIATAVDLPDQIELSSSAQDATTAYVTLSTNLHLAAYERSDEALINDFEEIIDQVQRGEGAESEIVQLFEGIVKDVLMENPRSIAEAVEQDWNALPMVDRMVCDSPIPLNEEQRKVLLAVRKPEGRIIVVEGPPGTGKSHTITAIAADCAFNKRSCLVLSDKIEALDVVQSKLSEVMNRVRHDRDFPNPLLRLGQQNANFKRLTANQTVNQVQSYARAMKANRPKLERELQETAATLKSAIGGTVGSLSNVMIADLAFMHEAEEGMNARSPMLASLLREQTETELVDELKSIEAAQKSLKIYLRGVFAEGDATPGSLKLRATRDTLIHEISREPAASNLALFERLTTDEVRVISNCLLQFRQLRMPIIGYLFRGSAIRQLESQINTLRTTRPLLLKQDADALEKVIEVSNALRRKLDGQGIGDRFSESYELLAAGRIPHEGCLATKKALDVFTRMNPQIVAELLAQPKDDERVWPLAISFLRRWIEIRTAFVDAPAYDYVGTKTRLEQLNTSIMNSYVDARLIDYMENHRADARALAQVVNNRQKFPEDKFSSVRESFPIIIASIREFGEFMPLIPNLFDVVVIDEASQVSVAQALPALLRARKVVVLGDSKQFSNVKSSNASNALNDKYRADLVQFFERSVTRDAATMQRLAMFDVKKSILEFCSLCASYSVMLRKHFRSYPELISYSSRMFYSGQLQALKLRSVPLAQAIRFDRVDASQSKNSRTHNEAEVEFILERLLELVQQEKPPTVGVITPFREQQVLLTKRLFGHAQAQDFESKLRLKVMTFDSCQGEERQIIFYSMVATPGADALNYIFPVAIGNAAEDIEDKLKVQRLNVGFSRAQETVWIVHSMPLEQYRASIGQALQHYANVLHTRSTATGTDAANPMEDQLLAWLSATQFVQSNAAQVQILPQFPVSAYLRELDPTYVHPAWRVDFLLIYRGERGHVHIVIEYDNFEHHFKHRRDASVTSQQRYLEEADVERQLTLESYGYRFLRVNRFNLGLDPVATLSARITSLVEMASGEPIAATVQDVQAQAEGLQSKELKACSRCGEIRTLEEFFDPALGNGAGAHGRVCMTCKSPEKASASSSRRRGQSG